MSAKNIKQRINTVRNIKKITGAMSLVANNKLKNLKSKFINSQSFYLDLENIAQEILCEFSQEKNKRVVILITSDRGLCGSYNINIARKAFKLYSQKKNSKLIIIGSKGVSIAKRENIKPDYLFDINNLSELSNLLINFFYKDHEIYLAYTKFYSNVKFIASYKKLLPVETKKNNIMFESNKDLVIKYFLEKYLENMIAFGLLESFVCEQSARMLSMNAASDNASEIINELILKYNRIRQNLITQELTEIISAANALI